MQGCQKAVWVSSSPAAIFPAAAVDRLHIAADRALFSTAHLPRQATGSFLHLHRSSLLIDIVAFVRVALPPIARALCCLA